MTSNSKNISPVTQNIKTIKNFLKMQSQKQVEQSKGTFNRKIIQRSQKLTQIDKTLLIGCITNTLILSLGMGFAFKVLNSKKLRPFPAFKWILGIGGLYVIGKSIYELPHRMAFADYLIKRKLEKHGQESNLINPQSKKEIEI